MNPRLDHHRYKLYHDLEHTISPFVSSSSLSVERVVSFPKSGTDDTIGASLFFFHSRYVHGQIEWQVSFPRAFSTIWCSLFSFLASVLCYPRASCATEPLWPLASRRRGSAGPYATSTALLTHMRTRTCSLSTRIGSLGAPSPHVTAALALASHHHHLGHSLHH